MDNESLALKLQETTDRSIRNEGRIKKLEIEQATLHSLATSVATLTSNQSHIEGDVKEIKADVKSIVEKPGKRWDTIIDKIIWAVLAAVIAFLLGKFGL